MIFPESNRVIFTKNPLDEVICQLRFPTILEISAERPAIFQKAIRSDYPLYEASQPNIPKDIQDLFSALPLPKPAESVTYKFSTADNSKAISLSPEFVAFTDNKYVRWEKFLREVQRAQQSLESNYQPAFYTRIGLRYINVIDREELGITDEPWDVLLKPFLLGLLGADATLGRRIEKINTVASVTIDDVNGAQATIRHGIGQRKVNNQEVYLIDTDFYTTDRSNSQDVADILRVFNRHIGNFFRWAITDRLCTVLEPRELRPED